MPRSTGWLPGQPVSTPIFQAGCVVGHPGLLGALRLCPMTEPESSFSVRIGARPERNLCEGVPDWLLEPLLDWLEKELYPGSARWVAVRQRLTSSVPLTL